MTTSDLTVGERTFLFLPDGSSCGAKVLAITGDTVTITAPSIAVESMPMVEDELDMQWFRSRGRYEVTVILAGVYDENGRHCWDLEFVTEPFVRQERRFVRGPGGQVATVTRESGDVVLGEVVDLAECSARVRFQTGHPLLHERVSLNFDIDDEVIATAGTVTRTSPGTMLGVDTVVMLDVSPQQADVLRRHIFAQQRRELRSANR